MTILSLNDYLSVTQFSLIADYDRQTISNLYEPIIGFEATALYFSFWSMAEQQQVSSLIRHNNFLIRIKMATGQFIEAREKLEAIGLLKTYLEKNNDINVYHYVLYAPKTPEKFFNDVLLYGLLIENVGQTDAEKIKNFYKISINSVEGIDISKNFIEIFKPDFSNEAFSLTSHSDNVIGRKKSKIDSEFSFEKFFEELGKCSQISSSSITKKEMKEIERLSALYGVKEDVSANCVAFVYDYTAPKGKRIDTSALNNRLLREFNLNRLTKSNDSFNAVNKEFSSTYIASNSDLAKKINLMEISSPREYLSYLQNNTSPADPDLRLIEDISRKFNLPNGVINAIIDIVLKRNNNILSKNYAEKIAGSFARENIKTALDAMNYYNKTSFKHKSYSKKDKDDTLSSEQRENSNSLSEKEMDDIINDSILFKEDK